MPDESIRILSKPVVLKLIVFADGFSILVSKSPENVYPHPAPPFPDINPFTSSLLPGLLVPIPTLPALEDVKYTLAPLDPSCDIPVASKVPDTCNLEDGLVVPIPTLPPDCMVILTPELPCSLICKSEFTPVITGLKAQPLFGYAASLTPKNKDSSPLFAKTLSSP